MGSVSGIVNETPAKRILFVSDGVMKGYQVIQAAADFRAQESIRSMTQRILTETER